MKREQWKSRIGFIWAAVGSAVGLGSIWRFPYVVGESGGAAFIVLYILCLFLVGFPVLLSEITIGRKTKRSPYNAFSDVGRNQVWGGIGKITIFTGFLVSTFYAVIAGLTFGYLIEAISGSLLSVSTAGEALSHYTWASSDPGYVVGFTTMFMVICFGVLFFGVQKGIEKGNKIMMPLLLIVLFALVLRGLFLEGAEKGIQFLFAVDFSKITPTAVLLALGQAFFSLSLGQGTMVTYGSYLQEKENIPTTTVPIMLFGLMVSMLAGIAIFTIVFSFGLTPSSGESLMFQTLPVVFSTMPGGYLLSIAFFILLFLAALTSEISAIEPMVSYLKDQWHFDRKLAVTVSCLGSLVIAIPCALSFGVLKDVTIFDMSIFNAILFLCVNILVPLGGLSAVLLAGWRWGTNNLLKEADNGAHDTFTRYPLLKDYIAVAVKYVAPAIIIIIFIDSIIH